jgi:hypothetical protein
MHDTPAGYYRDAAGLHPQHDTHGGPHDQPPQSRPLLLLVADESGTVLAGWRMPAHSPGGLVRQVAELHSSREVSADAAGLTPVDPAGWLLISAERGPALEAAEVCDACGGKIRAGRCRDCAAPSAAGAFEALAALVGTAETPAIAAAYTRLAGLALADAALTARHAEASAQLYEAIEDAKRARRGKSWPIVDLTGGGA